MKQARRVSTMILGVEKKTFVAGVPDWSAGPFSIYTNRARAKDSQRVTAAAAALETEANTHSKAGRT